jgi:hypothetical protein
MRLSQSTLRLAPACFLGGLLLASPGRAQDQAAAFNDHQNMLDQLHIVSLRPGKSGSNQTGPGFDLATANPWKDSMPDPLTMKDGTKVTRPDQWPARRAEILEDFEREVYGRIPANVPKVTWTVASTTPGNSGGVPIVTKVLIGHVDNSGYPQINVDIRASFTLPANATGPMPVIFEFGNVQGAPAPGGAGPAGARGARGPAAPVGLAGGPALPNLDSLKTGLTLTDAQAEAIKPILDADAKAQQDLTTATADNLKARNDGIAKITAALTDAQKPLFATVTTPGLGRRGGPGAPGGRGGPGGGGNPWQQQALAKGWGYGNIDPGSVQADGAPRAGAPMQGIIGLTNKGEARTPDQWGELRAWQWGVSRVIDYFEANPGQNVDATRIGITGVSRYGKAAIVAEAFEPRVAVALVGSSGEGGAKLHRHDFGESVENLTDNSEYGWMAGNFLKYGEAAPVVRTAADLPVDSHELIALCAPRPVFISYGVEAAGDPKWVDAPGSYMAAILAGPVYRLLGKQDLGVTDDYISAPMPPVGQLVGGELAWRQHEGGHTQVPNFPAFFGWVSNYIKSTPPVPAAAPK